MTDLRELDLAVDSARLVDEMERDTREGTMEHTPGPWRVEPHHREDIEGEVNGKWVEIAALIDNAALRDQRPIPTAYIREANARLIAAAPEMAAILLAAWQHVSHGGPTRADVEAVLRKAGLIQ